SRGHAAGRRGGGSLPRARARRGRKNPSGAGDAAGRDAQADGGAVGSQPISGAESPRLSESSPGKGRGSRPARSSVAHETQTAAATSSPDTPARRRSPRVTMPSTSSPATTGRQLM